MFKHRFTVIILLAVLVGVLFVTPMPAQRVAFGVGFYPGYWGGGWGWGGGYWGGPWGWGYPGYYGYGYGYTPDGRPLGEVKIKSPDSNAQVFINGSFAGQAHDLKRFYLVPGTYNIELRMNNGVQKQKVYVLANRSMHLDFRPGATPPPPPPPSAVKPLPEPEQAPAPPPAQAPTPAQ